MPVTFITCSCAKVKESQMSWLVLVVVMVRGGTVRYVHSDACCLSFQSSFATSPVGLARLSAQLHRPIMSILFPSSFPNNARPLCYVFVLAAGCNIARALGHPAPTAAQKVYEVL